MFVRFVVGEDREHHTELTGVITEARALRDEGRLEPYEIELLEESYSWLNENLPCPPFAQRSWGRDCACWFKESAQSSIEKMWDIIAILREHGMPVRMLRSRHPGRVLYEDDFQVVVREFSHL
ncbi:MAG: hypothetical protein U0165_00145 [Polyangiaceae bacterium]